MTNKPQTNRKKAKSADKTATNEIMESIRRLQNSECESKLEVINRRIEIGAELIKLKKAAGHGGWEKLRDELGYDERTAQRLMKLKENKLDDKIRDIVPDLAQRLPADVFKLEQLSRLNKTQLKKCLKAWVTSHQTMARAQVRDAVQAILKPGTPKTEQAKQTTSNGKAPDKVAPSVKSQQGKADQDPPANGDAEPEDMTTGGSKETAPPPTEQTEGPPEETALAALTGSCSNIVDLRDSILEFDSFDLSVARKQYNVIDEAIDALHEIKKHLTSKSKEEK